MLMLATVAALCVAHVAAADPAPLTEADYAGRWVSEKGALTLDLSRCGKGWCGIVVTDKACGHTALRVSESAKDAMYQTAKRREVVGRLQLATKTESYAVRAILIRDDDGPLRLSIAGHTGGAFAAYRRSYDYTNLLVREGDALCSPDPKLS
jgi:hypothetical protein